MENICKRHGKGQKLERVQCRSVQNILFSGLLTKIINITTHSTIVPLIWSQIKVKLAHCRTDKLRIQEFEAPKFSRLSESEDGKYMNLMHRLPLLPGDILPLETESTAELNWQGNYVRRISCSFYSFATQTAQSCVGSVIDCNMIQKIINFLFP